jgi:uncharacterized protein (DUF2147 family)
MTLKHAMTAAALVLGLAGLAAADPIEGRWRTAADDNGNSGLIEVVACGQAFCGTLIEAYGPDGGQIESPNIGRKIIWDTVPAGDGAYRGMIYSPDRDAEYKSKLQMAGDSLTVSGCRIGICRKGGVWQRQ